METTTATPAPTVCRSCGGRLIRWGKDRGFQRWRCKACGASQTDLPVRPMGALRIDPERAALVLGLLTEGSSVRSAQRLTGVHRDTICSLLRFAGEKAERLMATIIRKVEVKDVQADEIWGYVGKKEKTKVEQGITDPHVGDAYTFVGFERHSKLVLSWHLGRRTAEDTGLFMGKLAGATAGRFGLTVDGFGPYPQATEEHLGGRVDFAVLKKTYGADSSEDNRRYSPAKIIGAEKILVSGTPDPAMICTSHVERQNLHMRMQVRRLTRLTNAFSKKWENLKAALALHFWAFNFAWMHSSIRMTPAMKAGICRKPLRVADLLAS